MCGIAVVHDLRPDLDRLRAGRLIGEDMLARLHHRGPDGSGTRQVGPTWLGHTRLAIVDLDGGEQPLRSTDGDRWVVANGEIYNHDDLRSRARRSVRHRLGLRGGAPRHRSAGHGRHPRHARDVRLLHGHPARGRRTRARPAGDQAALLGQARRPGDSPPPSCGRSPSSCAARRGVPARPPLDPGHRAAGLRRPALRTRSASRRRPSRPSRAATRPSRPSGRPWCRVSASG